MKAPCGQGHRRLLPAVFSAVLLTSLLRLSPALAETTRAERVSTASATAIRISVPRQHALDVQVDPTPFFLHGFAPEVGYNAGQHRLYATVVAYLVPRFLDEDKHFSERRNAIAAIGYQYFLTAHLDGPFLGPNLALTDSTFTRRDGGHTHDTLTLKATLRAGWMWRPVRGGGFFVAPWVGPSFSFRPEIFSIDGQEIERRRVGVIGAVQLGWRFGL